MNDNGTLYIADCTDMPEKDRCPPGLYRDVLHPIQRYGRHRSELFIPHPRRRSFGQRFAVLQFFHDFFDGAVELLVFAVPFFYRIVIDEDIRLYAFVLYHPVTVHVVACEERHAHVGTVDKR